MVIFFDVSAKGPQDHRHLLIVNDKVRQKVLFNTSAALLDTI